MTLSSISAERRPAARGASAIAAAFALALATSATCAHADVPPRARALARTLFEDGRRLLNEKKFSEACPKLEESQRLDPAPGTQLNVAVCHEGEGRLATAWTEYNDALTQARRDQRPERAEFVATRLDSLSPQLSFMTIALTPGADVAGLEVVLDGATVGRAALGVPSPVDPGVHTVVAQARGRVPFKADVQIGPAGDRNSVSIPILVATAGGEVANAVAPNASTDAQTQSDNARASTRKIWGGTLVGVGAASLAVGVVFGIRAIDKWGSRNDACAQGCTAAGVAQGNAAQTSAWVANIAILAGVVAAGGGTYLLMTSGGSQAPTKSARIHAFPFFSATQAGLGLAGEL